MKLNAQDLINEAFDGLCECAGLEASPNSWMWDDGEAERWLLRIAQDGMSLGLEINLSSGKAYPVLVE